MNWNRDYFDSCGYFVLAICCFLAGTFAGYEWEKLKINTKKFANDIWKDSFRGFNKK